MRNVQLSYKKSVKSTAIALREVLSNPVIKRTYVHFITLNFKIFSASLIISLAEDCSLDSRKVVFLKYFFSKRTILNLTKIKLLSADISVSYTALD